MNTVGDLSVVIPCHDDAGTIGRTIASLLDGPAGGADPEIIIVDDGSPDPGRLDSVLANYPVVQLIRHERNKGMMAARNTGISASRGAFVTILDADDWFVPGWRGVFRNVVTEWPSELEVCYSACVTPEGEPTVAAPGYRGVLTFADMLAERRPGEYLPIFRGDYIRRRPYTHLGTRRSCGLLSYLAMLQDGPFWVTDQVLRIYRTDSPGSVSDSWGQPTSAAESVRCLEAVLAAYAQDYLRLAPRVGRRQWLRLGVYARLAGCPRRAWQAWIRGVHWTTAVESTAALGMMVVGPSLARRLVRLGKRVRLVKRFG